MFCATESHFMVVEMDFRELSFSVHGLLWMQPGLKYSFRLHKSETNEKKKNEILVFHLSYMYILGFLNKELCQSYQKKFKNANGLIIFTWNSARKRTLRCLWYL